MRRMGWFTAFALGLGLMAAGAVGTGCKSTHEEGVKSNIHSQWTDVSANTQMTTDAAKAVLIDQGLKDVRARRPTSTARRSGKMADGTKVNVDVKKYTDKIEPGLGHGRHDGRPEAGRRDCRRSEDEGRSDADAII
jgi:hypothetical protein